MRQPLVLQLKLEPAAAARLARYGQTWTAGPGGPIHWRPTLRYQEPP